MIPVILKGETSKPIQLTLREGYVYSGCVLAVCFRGVMKTFTDLVAGGTVELLYTAEETSTFPLGTGKVGLSIQNSAGDICFMPWAKIKVTDSPAEVHDAQITIDPATLNVSDATSKDSLGAVKSKLNAVLAFLRGLSSLAVLALPLYTLSDVAPLYSAFEDIPGDEQVVTNVVPYVDAKITAATNGIPRTVIPAYWPLYAVTNRDGTPVSSSSFDGLNIDGIGATASDAWQMATDALGGLSGVAQSATNYTDAARNEMASALSAFLPRSHYDGLDTATVGFGYGPGGLAFVPSEIYTQTAYSHHCYVVTDDEEGPLGAIGQYGGSFITARQEVENTIRAKSLGGIWDAQLEVWWTPIMENGALRYIATTNVNLNAGN